MKANSNHTDAPEGDTDVWLPSEQRIDRNHPLARAVSTALARSAMRVVAGLAVGVLFLALILLHATLSAAQADTKHSAAMPADSQQKQIDDETMRFEGEKRYSANCGRCHQRPHKLSRRVAATAVRHMRVRAVLTDQDVGYILWYLTR